MEITFTQNIVDNHSLHHSGPHNAKAPGWPLLGEHCTAKIKKIASYCHQKKKKKKSDIWQWDENIWQLKLILAWLYLSNGEPKGTLEPLTSLPSVRAYFSHAASFLWGDSSEVNWWDVLVHNFVILLAFQFFPSSSSLLRLSSLASMSLSSRSQTCDALQIFLLFRYKYFYVHECENFSHIFKLIIYAVFHC